MNKNLTIFALLLLVVVVVAYLYSGAVGSPTVVTNSPAGPALHLNLRTATEAMAAGELDLAEQLLREIPETDPSFGLAGQQLGLVEIRRGNLDAALAQLERVRRREPQNPLILLDLSAVYFRQGDYVNAEFNALRALEVDPANPSARYKIGLYQVAQGRLDDASETYFRAISSHGNLDLVEQNLRELMVLHESNPEIPAVHFIAAFFARTLDRRESEIEELQHFLALDPQGPAAELARKNLDAARQAVEP